MKRKNLLLKFWSTLFILSVIFSSAAFGQSATLTHSYTFEDGTADDVVGNANGVLQGDAVVANGEVTLSGNGYVSLPGKEINVPSYGSVSIESVFKQAPDPTITDDYTVIYSFGATNPDVDWMGINYILWQPTRADNANAKASISCGNTDNPWTTENAVSTAEIADTLLHYAVTVINGTEIKLYFDGKLIGSTPLSGSNALDSVSADTAYIGKDVYPNDPLWRGSVQEMNIYKGELDAATITQHAKDYLGIDINDATLDTLYSNTGTIDPAFDPQTDVYQITVPYGSTSITLNAIPTVSGASVSISDGTNDYPDGVVTFSKDEGITLSITVTALDGSTEKEYYLDIVPGSQSDVATLSGINLSAGNLLTDFNIDSTSYTAIIPYGTTSVDVTGVPSWDKATVEGDGTIDVSSGSASVAIKVTSEDGTNTMTYNVDLYVSQVTTGTDYYIQNEVTGFVIGGVLGNQPIAGNALKDEPTQLWHFVNSGVTGQYFIQNQENNYIALAPQVGDATWNMVIQSELPSDLDSARFVLNQYAPGTFKIVSVKRQEMDAAKNMMGTNDANANSVVYSDKWIGSSWDNNGYTIWNIKVPSDVVSPYDTHLSDLTIDGTTLNGFDSFTTDYTVTLPTGTTSINVDAIAHDNTSTISGTGTIDVTTGDSITITVTATDPSYKTNYVIHYKVDVPLTKMHSYTFADGTAQDQVGDLDGKVMGGSINDGIYTASAEGDYIEFNGPDLAINKYTSITLEAYVVTGDNPGWTMLAYFGSWGGWPSYWMSIARNDDVSMTTIDAGHGAYGAKGIEPGTGEAHHYVSVVSNDTIYWYIDGYLTTKTATPANTTISGLTNDLAFLCYGGYKDPTYKGDIYEFNIYEGQMDAQTIANRAYDFPVEDSTMDATLSALMIDGDTIQGFASYNLNYDDSIAQESTKSTITVPTITATPKYPNQTVEITPADGVPGATKIVVTAEDGVTKVTYTVNFTVKNSKSTDATLSDLQVDGATIDGFDAATMTYNVELETGTTTVPTVTATSADANATVNVTSATELPGATTVVVTAEDGVTIDTYTINFTVKPTAVTDINETSITVYPTVSSGSFKVKTDHNSSIITVYNMTGNVVKKQISNGYEKEITVPTVGMYIMKVESNGVTKTFKVIKTN